MTRIVLVHGAFGGAWVWEPALPGLRAARHDLQPIDLPGSGEDRTPIGGVTLDSYAKRICEALGEGGPAVWSGRAWAGAGQPGGRGRPSGGDSPARSRT
jgi:pimeloyl-ACP methyl ester carboxylesterase